MSQFIDKYFPTFKSWFCKTPKGKKPGKTRKFFRGLFLILIFLAAAIIVKEEFKAQLDVWDEMGGYYEDDEYYDDAGYCEAGDNVEGIIMQGSLYTYIPEPFYNDPTLLDDTLTASETIVHYISEAEKNDQIKAILIEVDCIGGEGTAAKEVADAIKRAKKPTVAIIREYGTSACYWAATGADAIFANTTSNVGSIGVTMSYLDYSGQNTKEGLIYQQISSGKFKDSGDPDKVLTPEEKAILQQDVDDLHEVFVSEVATNRNMDREVVAKLADGTSMIGQKALDAGLIDYLGDEFAVEQYLKDKLGEEVSICW